MANINMPESFQVKNFVVDRLMQHLQTVAECKVINIVYRQTIGWQRTNAPIAARRFEQLSGMGFKSLISALEWLADVGAIIRMDQTRDGMTYGAQIDEALIDWAAIEKRTLEKHTATKQRTEKSLAKANQKKAEKRETGFPSVPTLGFPSVGNPSVGTVPTIETKETKLNPIAADAAKVSIADATKPISQNNTSRTDMDFLDMAFNRMEKQANDPSAKIAGIVRRWNAAPHLADICIQFARLSGVPVTPADKGKWLSGAKRLHELAAHGLSDQVVKAALDKARHDRISVTHPNAIYEGCKDQLAVQPAKTAEPALVQMSDGTWAKPYNPWS